MKMKLMKWIAAVSFITLISMCSVPVKAEDFTIPESALGDVIGHVYASDILATVNGVPIPSYNIGDKTAIAVEDLRYYGFDVTQSVEVRSSGGGESAIHWCTVEREESDVMIIGLSVSRVNVGATLGEVIGNIYAANLSLEFMDYRNLPCFIIDGRICAAIEDLSYYLHLVSHDWDSANRVIDLTVHEPIVQTVNLAEIIGRPFDEVGILLGNVLNPIYVGNDWYSPSNGLEPDYNISTRDFLFDTAIAAHTTTLDNTVPEYIENVFIEYDQEDGVRSYFMMLEEFSGFDESRRFHFNGLDYTSTRDDVRKMFSNTDFRQTYVRNLTVFGTGDPRTWERTYNYAEVKVLPPSAEAVLKRTNDNMIYWNNEFAITFDFDSDSIIIGFTILSNVMK